MFIFNKLNQSYNEIPTKSKANPALGSFTSFIHKTYIDNQTTKQLVESFIAKKPKYEKAVVEDIANFFELANRAIERKRKRQV